VSYRLGVDVGGTFTDLLLVDEASGATWSAKVPSTPQDQSIGVLTGLERVCSKASISPKQIDHVMHGTTVATNTVLTGTGAKCGLVTTRGYRQVLQIARSYVPGGLGGWVIYNKSLPMAPLACTIEAHERVSAHGEVVEKLNEQKLREDLRQLRKKNIEALTVSLINSFANDSHEQRGIAGNSSVAVVAGRAGNAGVRAHGDDCRQLVREAARCAVRAESDGEACRED
jgi:N-methylhydantoinase A